MPERRASQSMRADAVRMGTTATRAVTVRPRCHRFVEHNPVIHRLWEMPGEMGCGARLRDRVTLDNQICDVSRHVLCGIHPLGRYEHAEMLLSAAVPTSVNSHHILASRAPVREPLEQWGAAFLDATEVLIALLFEL